MIGIGRRRVATALLIGAAIAACTESSRERRLPTAPSTTTPPPFVSRLRLSGPDTVHIGQPTPFTLTAEYSDGTSRDVTGEAIWRSSRPDVVELTAPGVFTGRAKGEASISASLTGRTSTIGEVIVVPPGTYRLIGTVRDAGVPVDARVQVEDDVSGSVEVDAVRGNYVIYGVAGEARITVRKDGYETQTRVQRIDAHQRVDFELVFSGSRPDLTGRYRLTINAASTCTFLTDELRDRSFEAVLEQAGPRVTVTLQEAEFGTDQGRTLNQLRGVADGNRVIFDITSPALYYFYYYYSFIPDVAVRLSGGGFYSFDGTVEATLSGGSIRGLLNGAVGRLTGPPYVPALRCRSSQHRFELTR